jgi:hypothetical protein
MALPALRTVEIQDDAVLLNFDWMNGERTIHLNLTEHPVDLAPSLQGHSIGHWEGEILVIDTVGFAPHREGVGFGIPSGAGKHLAERLTLDEERTSITYEFTVTDPESLTEAVTHSVQWNYRPDLIPSGQQCDPEIATRFLNE